MNNDMCEVLLAKYACAGTEVTTGVILLVFKPLQNV